MKCVMTKYSVVAFLFLVLLSSCGEYSYVQKTNDYEYKYELAKASYIEGRYGRASELFVSVLAIMKGTTYGEECLYMLAKSTFMQGDYESAASYFQKYYQSYPRGTFVEQARYYSGYSLYKQTPDVRLDQQSTRAAINEFQTFIDAYPNSSLREPTQELIYLLQDKLVEKEYLAAKLYYDLGNYRNNSAYGGSNYEACVVTAQNALKDYPFASPERREEFGILILRSKYELARQSVEEKHNERYRDAIDEYYAFINDFPESKYLAEATSIFKHADNFVKKKKLNITEEE